MLTNYSRVCQHDQLEGKSRANPASYCSQHSYQSFYLTDPKLVTNKTAVQKEPTPNISDLARGILAI